MGVGLFVTGLNPREQISDRRIKMIYSEKQILQNVSALYIIFLMFDFYWYKLETSISFFRFFEIYNVPDSI